MPMKEILSGLIWNLVGVERQQRRVRDLVALERRKSVCAVVLPVDVLDGAVADARHQEVARRRLDELPADLAVGRAVVGDVELHR
jgi:hypothetical protein